LRILVVSNDSDLRVALQILLREEPCCDVVAAVSNSESAISLIIADRPDLIVLDWDMPNGLAKGIPTVVSQFDLPPIVVAVGESESERYVAISAGVDAYELKLRSPERLVTTILEASQRVNLDRKE
jgi:DNA-binding NarL/FixJ family response regulator